MPDIKLKKLLDMLNSLTKIDDTTGAASLDLANAKVDGTPAKFKSTKDWLNAIASFDVVVGENPSGSISIENLDPFLSTGDASPDLAAVLDAGAITGGTSVVVTAGDSLLSADGADLTIAAGASTAGDGQDVNITASAAFAAGGGDGGNINLRPGLDDGAGAEGAVRIFGVDNDDYITVTDFGVVGNNITASGQINIFAGGTDEVAIMENISTHAIRVGSGLRRLANTAGSALIEWGSGTDVIGFYGATPATQPVHIVDATGGATVDAEARTAINALLAQMATLGLQAAA